MSRAKSSIRPRVALLGSVAGIFVVSVAIAVVRATLVKGDTSFLGFEIWVLTWAALAAAWGGLWLIGEIGVVGGAGGLLFGLAGMLRQYAGLFESTVDWALWIAPAQAIAMLALLWEIRRKFVGSLNSGRNDRRAEQRG